jgi:outer membrane protein assembly factor BamA
VDAASRVDDLYAKSGEQVDRVRDEPGVEKGKWLPVPIPLSNPTIGSGLQAVLLYLHPKKQADSDAPNATSGIGAMYTDSDSKALAAFHDNYFVNDRFRFRGLVGTMDFNLQFYGVGSSLIKDSIDYNIKADTAMLQFLGRVPKTKSWYLGLRYLAIESDLSFSLEEISPELPDLEAGITVSNLGLILNYDTRDDNYYPTKGSYLTAVMSEDSENWGSDFDYSKNAAQYVYYLPLADQHTLALKGSLSDVGDEAPFFMLSTLSMRGFAGGRYLDNSSTSVHAEWRYKFSPRWGFVGFTEAGRVASSIDTLSDSTTITSYGAGLRWQAIASKKINISIDYAISDDDEAAYLRIGESF